MAAPALSGAASLGVAGERGPGWNVPRARRRTARWLRTPPGSRPGRPGARPAPRAGRALGNVLLAASVRDTRRRDVDNLGETADGAQQNERDAGKRAAPWWRGAVVYQVYLRSFADGDGDGVGDIAGLRARLPYLRDLGADAIWLNPWYPSPMVDGGYDVSDYRDIAPVFGTRAAADALIGEAHEQGLRVLIDLVPNHTSDRHPWFQAALAAGPGSPERERYWFRRGR